MADKPNNLSIAIRNVRGAPAGCASHNYIAIRRKYLGPIAKRCIVILWRSKRCIDDIFARLFLLF